MSVGVRIIRGRRVAVVSPRCFASAARTMARLGWPKSRICAALRMQPARLARILAPAHCGIWGEMAGVLAEEMRRAA